MIGIDSYTSIIENIKFEINNSYINNNDKTNKIIDLLFKLQNTLQLNICTECKLKLVLKDSNLCRDCNFEKNKVKCSHCETYINICNATDVEMFICIINNIKLEIINEIINEDNEKHKNNKIIDLLDDLKYKLMSLDFEINTPLKDIDLCNNCNFEKHKVQCIQCGIYAILGNNNICAICHYKNNQGICAKCHEFRVLIRGECFDCFTPNSNID